MNWYYYMQKSKCENIKFSRLIAGLFFAVAKFLIVKLLTYKTTINYKTHVAN